MKKIMARLATLLVLCAGPASATEPTPQAAPWPDADAQTAPEQWTRTKTAAGEKADLAAFCAAQPVTTPPSDFCQQLSPGFVQWLLTHDDPTRAMSRRGIQILHAVITGSVNLQNAHVSHPVSIADSTIHGDIDLTGAHFSSNLTLSGSTIDGDLQASGVSVGGNLALEKSEDRRATTVMRQVNLIGATVEGFGHFSGLTTQMLVMNSSHFRHDLVLDDTATLTPPADDTATLAPIAKDSRGCADADWRPGFFFCGHAMIVDGQFRMAGEHLPDKFYLADAEVHGDLTIGGIGVDLNLNSIRVDGTLHLRSAIGTIDMTGAEVGHYWNLDAKSVLKINAANLHVRQKAQLNFETAELYLQAARIDGELAITVDGRAQRFTADLSRTQIGYAATIDCGGATCQLTLPFLNVAERLTIQGKALDQIYLYHANISGELILGSPKWTLDQQGSRKVRLSLRNAQAGSVSGGLDAWPDQQTDLHAFNYGDYDLKTTRQRIDWLDRDPKHEPQVYMHLASMLAAQGDRDGASDVQYAALEWERRTAWQNWQLATGAWLSALKWLAGYGLGYKTWWCLVPIAVFAFIGARVISRLPGAHDKGPVWHVAAGLHNLLPYHPVDRKISEFLDKQEEFPWPPKLALFALWVVGVFLALFLAAAATGLTQKG